MPNTNDQIETEPGSGVETNRLRETTVEPHIDVEQPPKYRELLVEPPKEPWHLTIEPPVDYDGKRYTELVFDYDALIAKDFVRAERTFYRIYKPDRNEGAVLPEMHHDYQIILAAQVADVPVGLIYKLPRRFYIPVRLEAVKACGGSPEEEKA
jgi:hypothetical protein